MDKKCFVISIIGEKSSEERKYADRLFKFIIEPAANSSGYGVVERADHFDETGMITNQIIEAIQNYDLVVADLTHKNPNVYYELAVRHHTGKPLVQIMLEGTKLPFDVAQMRTMPFGIEVEDIEAAKIGVIAKIAASTDASKRVENPITQARNVHELVTSKDEQSRALAAIMEVQSSILGNVTEILAANQFLVARALTKSRHEEDIDNAIFGGDKPYTNRLLSLKKQGR